MAKEAIKLEEKELENLKTLQLRSRALIQELGSISLAEINLEERREAAENFLKESRQLEAGLAKALEEKYGKGNIDVTTGEFTPIE